jgi:predicted ATPase
MATLKKLTIRGYKSIESLEDFELGSLNVLIGANGAGKSNFISLFQLLHELLARQLQLFVQDQGGPDALLYRGRKQTPEMYAAFYFAQNSYRFSLRASGEKLVFAREETGYGVNLLQEVKPLGSGHTEAELPKIQDDIIGAYILPSIMNWRVYHFNDTSPNAPARQATAVRDNFRLKADAANLAPFLRLLREQYPSDYARIVQTIRLVAPFFGDFVYQELRRDRDDRVALEWTAKSDPDTPYGPRQLSDGTLRFIALATLLLQPVVLQQETMIIDEPELGLHPYAINVLAELLKRAAEERQLIIATQSAELISAMDPGQVVVANQHEGASSFARPDPEELEDWLKDYALGELWEMNIIGGRPTQ